MTAPEQITKEQAQFSSAYDGDVCCGKCSMYTDGTCSLVLGIIDPAGVCVFFAPDRKDWEWQPKTT